MTYQIPTYLARARSYVENDPWEEKFERFVRFLTVFLSGAVAAMLVKIAVDAGR